MMQRLPVKWIDALRWMKEEFKRAGVPEPEKDAEVLLQELVGTERWRIYLEGHERVLDERQVEKLVEWVERRKRREPLQYITGVVYFYGMVLKIDRRALVPRQETEALVETALELLQGQRNALVCDVGCGAGAVALAIAGNCDCKVLACDIDEGALSLARENAERLGLGGRLDFF